MGRASNDNLGVLLGPRAPMLPMWPQVAKSGSKKPKSVGNEMELRSFHHWTRLDDLIILVWSNVKIV